MGRAAKGGRFLIAFLAFLLLLTGAACLPRPSPEPEVTPKPERVPGRFEVTETGSIVKEGKLGPELTVFLTVKNSSPVSRAFKSLQLVLFDAGGSQLRTAKWGAGPSLTMGPYQEVPVALAFSDLSTWARARVSFTGVSPAPAYRDLEVSGLKKEAEGPRWKVSGTVRNVGPGTAVEMVIIVAGYDSDGNMVAWGCSRPIWMPLGPGKTRGFTIESLLGLPERAVTLKAFLSARRQP